MLRLIQDNTKTDIKLGHKWQVKLSDSLLEMAKNQLMAEDVEIVY
jgi:hypothetical protein